MRGLKNIRLPGYDYKLDGLYFVTAVANYRQKFFRNRKQSVEKIIRETVRSIKGVSIDTLIIMDDHIHLILYFHQASLSLGEVVRRIKAKVSHALGASVWQPNYYEHVIRSEEALDRIREYILLNQELERAKFEQFYKRSR